MTAASSRYSGLLSQSVTCWWRASHWRACTPPTVRVSASQEHYTTADYLTRRMMTTAVSSGDSGFHGQRMGTAVPIVHGRYAATHVSQWPRGPCWSKCIPFAAIPLSTNAALLHRSPSQDNNGVDASRANHGDTDASHSDRGMNGNGSTDSVSSLVTGGGSTGAPKRLPTKTELRRLLDLAHGESHNIGIALGMPTTPAFLLHVLHHSCLSACVLLLPSMQRANGQYFLQPYYLCRQGLPCQCQWEWGISSTQSQANPHQMPKS